MSYLLLADEHVFKCQSWDDLVDRLLWAREQRYRQAKGRRTSALTDRPLLLSEEAVLVRAATAVALAGD